MIEIADPFLVLSWSVPLALLLVCGIVMHVSPRAYTWVARLMPVLWLAFIAAFTWGGIRRRERPVHT